MLLSVRPMQTCSLRANLLMTYCFVEAGFAAVLRRRPEPFDPQAKTYGFSAMFFRLIAAFTSQSWTTPQAGACPLANRQRQIGRLFTARRAYFAAGVKAIPHQEHVSANLGPVLHLLPKLEEAHVGDGAGRMAIPHHARTFRSLMPIVGSRLVKSVVSLCSASVRIATMRAGALLV